MGKKKLNKPFQRCKEEGAIIKV